MLLLDLDLADVAGMLDNFGDVSLVTSAHLTGDTLCKIDKSTVHPVLPKDTNSLSPDRNTEWSNIGLNHAERSVGGPEYKENHEHVVRVPESLVVGSACLLHTGDDHARQGDEHNVTCPARSRHQVSEQEAVDTKVVLGRNLGKVIPVSDGVNPAEEENGPGDSNVEGDVLVELNDAVERRLTCQRNKCPADGEQDHGDVEMQYQRCRSSNHVRRSEDIAGSLKIVLDSVVDETECKHHCV